jgi:REP element-mobilizing transposase RayT
VRAHNNHGLTMPYHHSHLLRKGRYSEPGRAYLVTTVTEGRLALFADWQVGRAVVRELAASPVDTLAWVLMPDHLHWLLQLREESLGEAVGRMKTSSARAVNRRLGRDGAVWQKGYHDHALRSEEDLQEVARYVVANPVRAGLVEKVGDWPLWDACWL